MRAVAAVVQTVALEHRVVRHIHVQRVADEADVVVQDLRALGVVELHAVAALRRGVLALAGDDVVLDAHVVGFLDPQAEQVVRQIAVAHHGTVRAGVEVDAGVLRLQVVARVTHDQSFDHHVRRGHADGVTLVATAQGRAVQPAQRQRLVDQQVGAVLAALHLHRVAGLGRAHGGGQVITRAYGEGGCLAGPGDPQHQGPA